MREIDLTFWDNGKPHWLSLRGRYTHIFQRDREKHRALHRAKLEAEREARQSRAAPTKRRALAKGAADVR